MTTTRSNGGRHTRVAAAACALTGLLLAGCGTQNDPAAAQPPQQQSSSPSTPDKKQALTLTSAMKPSKPVRVKIPAIDVNSPINPLGLKPDNTLEVPPLDKPKLTGWYKKGPTPGELGPAVILGHVDSNDAPAVFYDLKTLKQGARVKVTRKNGSVAIFEVTSVEQFAKKDFPTKRVYGDLDHPGLRLITCGGVFNEGTGHYKDNIIAFARLVSAKKAKA